MITKSHKADRELLRLIQKSIPECTDESAREIAESYQKYIRLGFDSDRLLRIFLVVFTAILSSILLMAGLIGIMRLLGIQSLQWADTIQKVLIPFLVAGPFIYACNAERKKTLDQHIQKYFANKSRHATTTRRSV